MLGILLKIKILWEGIFKKSYKTPILYRKSSPPPTLPPPPLRQGKETQTHTNKIA